jgi:asparagine synthase (glutamine-hydrolysing)
VKPPEAAERPERSDVSAIVGIYALDGQPVDRSDLERMTATLAHRGPDGEGLWAEGPVGLGHRMLWTTPESLWERLPQGNETSECTGAPLLVLTADARIDNREELISRLGLRPHGPGSVRDSDLILAAYERWGENCPEALLGDFAFAIWDRRKQTLFCARDHFGVKPFFYYASGRTFAFASEIKALFCLPEVPRRLNEVRVADYLVSLFADKAITFYQEILRLPPGCRMTVRAGRMQLASYWTLDPSRELRLRSDEEYAEAFRERFAEAVRCRVRSAFPVGSLLSGGLDSSSVTCMARELSAGSGGARLRTFSAVFDAVPACDERRFIAAVLAQGGYEPLEVPGDQYGPFTDLERVLWYEDEAVYGPGLFLNWVLHRAARDRGVRVLLSGHDGDATVSHGFGYLDELASSGRWLALAIEVKGLARLYRESPGKLWWQYAREHGLVPRVDGSSALRSVRRAHEAVGHCLRRSRIRPAERSHLPLSAMVHPDFRQRTGLAERYQAARLTGECVGAPSPGADRSARPDAAGATQSARAEHYQTLADGIQSFGLEVLDRAACPFSLEARYPFWDKRLVEFCLALPPEQKLNRGWSRVVMRRAMAGIVPEEVRWRPDKTDFLPNLARGLRTFERERVDQAILRDARIIEPYVNVPVLRETYHRFLAGGSREDPHDVCAIWRVVSLAVWLRHVGFTP